MLARVSEAGSHAAATGLDKPWILVVLCTRLPSKSAICITQILTVVKVRARVGNDQWFVVFSPKLSSTYRLLNHHGPFAATCDIVHSAVCCSSCQTLKGTALNYAFPYPPALLRLWAEC